MNRLKWLLLFLVITCSANAQQFKLVEDTIRINASDFISPISRFEMRWAVKYHEYYFCIFEEDLIYSVGAPKNRLLVISEDGNNIKEVDLPADFLYGDYGDIFVRNDKLFLKPYLPEKKRSYYFDMAEWEWVPIKMVSNIIYEDKQYRVAVKEMGEWGDYTWFIERSPICGNEYIMAENLSRIIKKDSTYYFIRGGKIDTLVSLKGKAQLCKPGQKHKAVARRNYKYLYRLGSSMDSLNTSPIPTLYHFFGIEDKNWWKSEKLYDTLCINAFLSNGNIYYLLNTENKTYIAQLKGGKMCEKFNFGHRYEFFRVYDNYRGKNFARNQCFEQFEENVNSYGVLEIKDSLIHICHIIHNQDSLPHIGTDNIEPLLKYLLNHLNNLTFSQIDSIENALHATCDGKFLERYSQISIGYHTVVDNKKALTVSYLLQKSDSIVISARFKWGKTRIYNNIPHYRSYGYIYENKEFTQILEQKCAEVSQILTALTGTPPVEVAENNSNFKFLMWTYNNIIVKLYDDGRMSMYMTED